MIVVSDTSPVTCEIFVAADVSPLIISSGRSLSRLTPAATEKRWMERVNPAKREDEIDNLWFYK